MRWNTKLTRWSSSRSNLVYLLDAIRILILDECGDVGPLVLLPLVGDAPGAGCRVGRVCSLQCLGCRRRVSKFGRELVFIDYNNVAT